MNCQCGKNIDKKWNFCPYCGRRIDKGFRFKFPGFSRKEENIEDEFQMMNKQVEQMFKMFGLPGKVNVKVMRGEPGGMVPVQPRTMQKKKKIKAESPPEEPKKVKEMLEPITKMTKTVDGLKTVMQLPGVKSGKDVKIRKFTESIEIRAYADQRGYFKVIPVGPNSEIIDKKFANEMLKLVIKG